MAVAEFNKSFVFSRQVQEAIDRAMVGRTVIIIAHRLSTVKHADCVMVVSKGKIVEKGTLGALTHFYSVD